MANEEIIKYAKNSLEGGYSIEQITSALSRQGWGEQEINEAIRKAQEIIQQKSAVPNAPTAPLKKHEWDTELRSLSASQILLYLGGLVVVLAGIIYISINWTLWGQAARIFAILLPMLISYVTGVSMFFSREHKIQSRVFLVVGSLLFPLFLSVVFKELGIFTKSFNDNFNLTVSLLSFLLYLVSSFIFRFPVWTLLYQLFALLAYYFFLKIIGIEVILEKPTMAWLFFIPGTAYLFLSLFYEKNGRRDEGHYSRAIGEMAIILSLARSYVETFTQDGEQLAWLLLFFGVAYFLLGIFYEKVNFKKSSQVAYRIGVGVVFLSLFSLTVKGVPLGYFMGFTNDNGQEIVGWSGVVVGIIYLVLAYVVEKLKNFQLEQASKFKEFFNFFGVFGVLGGIFYLGIDGSKPVYETLLLLSSLGFIFGSVPRLVRQYLLVGTLFLIVYIFSIGGEYFQNEVGWPIVLFVAGFASMGIGIVMEKVRRKYFFGTKV